VKTGSVYPSAGSKYYYKVCRKGDPDAKAVTVNESPVRAIADEINHRIPAVKEMVALADISALRDWIPYRKEDPPVRVDILEQLWYTDKLRLNVRAPSDVVEEAIGKYQSDQAASWRRTFNPFYLIGRLINFLVEKTFNVVTLFGVNRRSGSEFDYRTRNIRFGPVRRLVSLCSGCTLLHTGVFRV
jgi:hypothetical protein